MLMLLRNIDLSIEALSNAFIEFRSRTKEQGSVVWAETVRPAYAVLADALEEAQMLDDADEARYAGGCPKAEPNLERTRRCLFMCPQTFIGGLTQRRILAWYKIRPEIEKRLQVKLV